MITVSPLDTNLQVVNFQRFDVSSHVQSRKLVHVSGVNCQVHAFSTSGCAFVYFTVQHCIEYSSTVSLFQAQHVLKQVYKQRYMADCVSWVPQLTLLDL